MVDKAQVREVLQRFINGRNSDVEVLTSLSNALVEQGGAASNPALGEDFLEACGDLAIKQACVQAFREYLQES